MPSLLENWVGEKYHYHSSQQKAVAELLIKQFQFKKTDHVLDVGCGDGKITAKLASLLPKGHILGIDSSPSMIAFAKHNYENGNIRFTQERAAEISFENQFDVITSFSALHWEPKQKETLLRFKAALKPQGWIVLLIPGPEPILRAVLSELCSSFQWKEYFEDYQSPGKVWTANEYASLLLEIPFVIRKIEAVERPYAFEERAYGNYVEAMLPHLTRLPENKWEEFIAHIIEAVKRKGHVNCDGNLKFDITALEIIAQRA